MSYSWISCVLVVSLGAAVDGNRLLTFSTPEEYLNICMDGISHKLTPGPESALFDMCAPWKEHSCCTKEISEQLHVNTTWYKMDYNHCPQKPLSDKCRGRFTQDLCLYECSPNVGPWLVKVNGMKIRNERFVDVPLCHTECSAWWEDCKDEFTCVENWSRAFDWATGFPECPKGSTCRTFTEMYKNSTNFCEKVFDHSWKVVDDDTPCFLMWWNENSTNPNYDVALQRAQQIVSGSSRVMPLLSGVFALVVIVPSFLAGWL